MPKPPLIRRRALAALVAFTALPATAQPADSAVFQLGAIEIRGEGERDESLARQGATRVDEEEIRARDALDVGQAISRLPGVTLTSGSRRAETWAFIRGFDARQITLNLDGIPIYVPYDGNVDLSRFPGADFSEIVITKGLGSLLYGPNNMGGSINLISRRPERALEGSVGGGIVANEDKLYTNHVTARLAGRPNALFYFSGGVTQMDSSGYPLSSSFEAVPAQPSGDRLHADSRSGTANLKLGLTPNTTDEYALSYYRVDGRKGAPPYAGNVPGNLVYWDWPRWDKESVYFIGHTALGKGYLKTRLYHDSFQNALTAYDDARLSTTKKNSSFRSTYDDATWGGSIEGGLPVGAHLLKATLFYKHDTHRETDLAKDGKSYDSPWLRYASRTASAGVEDVWSLNDESHLTLGLRHDRFKVEQVEEYADNAKTRVQDVDVGPSSSANNLMLTYDHRLGAHTLRAGVALKTRFPTLKERYSYRLGRAIPNPALSAEKALHTEIGARGALWNTLRYDVALFHANLRDAIESVALTPSLQQMQNVGTARNYGLEAALDMPLGESLALSARYTWLERKLGADGLVPTLTPKHQLYTTLAWFATTALELDLDIEAASRRQTTTDGLRPVAAYGLVNLRGSYALNRQVTLYAGLYNAFDKNYAITEGDPMPGRTLHASVNVTF